MVQISLHKCKGGTQIEYNLSYMNTESVVDDGNCISQGVGMMKGRINLDYERSPDPYDRHRALYLYLPTTEMTGDYTCKVSTLQNDVSSTRRMTVYGEQTTNRDHQRLLFSHHSYYPPPRSITWQNTFQKVLRYIQIHFHLLQCFEPQAFQECC